ncbi:unnamed protein product [Aphis gossypii]|uniref:Uncharacterized protein n=1 Tax=Aphis gossypii TaxID=80765 RepID=A0A9P0J898_APHGO|nr:unnamed protein product [Aphis gossypii]
MGEKKKYNSNHIKTKKYYASHVCVCVCVRCAERRQSESSSSSPPPPYHHSGGGRGGRSSRAPAARDGVQRRWAASSRPRPANGAWPARWGKFGERELGGQRDDDGGGGGGSSSSSTSSTRSSRRRPRPQQSRSNRTAARSQTAARHSARKLQCIYKKKIILISFNRTHTRSQAFKNFERVSAIRCRRRRYKGESFRIFFCFFFYRFSAHVDGPPCHRRPLDPEIDRRYYNICFRVPQCNPNSIATVGSAFVYIFMYIIASCNRYMRVGITSVIIIL